MSTQLTRSVLPGFAIALGLTACDRAPVVQSAAQTSSSAGELAWARAALERNPQLEVVASDPQTGVLTVRNRSTGEIQAVKPSELAAAPVSQLNSMNVQPSSPAEPEPAPPADDAPAQSAQTSTERGSAQSATSTTATQTTSGYTIDRSGGQVRVSGPGVSIVSSGSGAAGPGQSRAGQRGAAEPFICEGRRTLTLDSRDIYVEGDAITARGGCELFIINSRVVASGTGIVVQDATVHVSNSHIEGANSSFQADDRARLFVRGSTFQGVPRRTELAMVQDQGGNKWR